MPWTETNRKETHLQHNGKIVGKIMRDWTTRHRWYCFCPTSPKVCIGYRMSVAAAKRMVERRAGPEVTPDAH
jgi:hypothetical protein